MLKDEYDYNPAVPGFQNEVFGGCIRHVLSVGGSERDAAALFMLSQVGMMSDPLQLDEVGQSFVRRIRDKIWTDWDQLVINHDISEMMAPLGQSLRTEFQAWWIAFTT